VSAPLTLITGGAGFVGVNLADHLLQRGEQVRILDSLARSGSERNIEWLLNRRGERPEFVRADVRDRAALASAMAGVDHVVHLAAQVAVTSSLADPRADFEANALGTLNVLEAARSCARPPSSLAFTSTNKVYGALGDIALRAHGRRYLPENEQIREHGVSEERPLDFHSPYGCSKGAADQYVLDYSRSFGLRTVVLRMSCIYGPHQHGNEDQGWVAHFVRCALADRAITVYGDGMQVRDLLFVADLIDAIVRARECIEALSGRAFNIGGGVANTASVLEVLEQIEQLTGRSLRIRFDAWRVGDQRYYVSETARFSTATGWRPRTGMQQGMAALCEWLARSLSAADSARSSAQRAAAYP
jgi:CDP-paratose 2-epimerase